MNDFGEPRIGIGQLAEVKLKQLAIQSKVVRAIIRPETTRPGLFELFKLQVQAARTRAAELIKKKKGDTPDPRKQIIDESNRSRLKTTLRNAGTRILLGGAIASLVAGGIGLMNFYVTNPKVDGQNLRALSSEFLTSQIVTRDGVVADEIIREGEGRRLYAAYDDISPEVVNATVAVEDKRFWSNPGFDPVGMIRALTQNITQKGVVSGASTVTQQLARSAFLEDYSAGSLEKKIREIMLAHEITGKYTKKEIMELYLNQVYYGNGAYGIEAAAQTYYGKSSKNLSIGESAFLVGLVQSPAVYDPYTDRQGAMARLSDVLGLLKANGSYTQEQIDQARLEMEQKEFQALKGAYKYRPWVRLIENQLAALYPEDQIYKAGVRVEATIDTISQQGLETFVNSHVNTDSAIVFDTKSGAIVALGGEIDPFRIELQNKDDEQVNLLDLGVLYEAVKKNNINPFGIQKIIENKTGKEVSFDRTNLGNTSVSAEKEIIAMSDGIPVQIPNATDAIMGTSDTSDGYRYHWFIAHSKGRTVVYWVSESDESKAIQTFSELISSLDTKQSASVNHPGRLAVVKADTATYIGGEGRYAISPDDDRSIPDTEAVGYRKNGGYYLRGSALPEPNPNISVAQTQTISSEKALRNQQEALGKSSIHSPNAIAYRGRQAVRGGRV